MITLSLEAATCCLTRARLRKGQLMACETSYLQYPPVCSTLSGAVHLAVDGIDLSESFTTTRKRASIGCCPSDCFVGSIPNVIIVLRNRSITRLMSIYLILPRSIYNLVLGTGNSDPERCQLPSPNQFQIHSFEVSRKTSGSAEKHKSSLYLGYHILAIQR